MEMQIVIKDNYWKKNLVIIYGNWCKMLIFNSGNKDFPGNRVEGGECNNEYTKTKYSIIQGIELKKENATMNIQRLNIL